jgi:hypothetical protein
MINTPFPLMGMFQQLMVLNERRDNLENYQQG